MCLGVCGCVIGQKALAVQTFYLRVLYELIVVNLGSFAQILLDQFLHVLWRDRCGDVLHQNLGTQEHRRPNAHGSGTFPLNHSFAQRKPQFEFHYYARKVVHFKL